MSAHERAVAHGAAEETSPSAGAEAPGEAAGVAPIDGRASAAATGVALVPRGGCFEGRVALVGETIIDGTVVGSLRGTGELILGPEARVEGAVECDRITSRGHIDGPVVARRHAHLSGGARLDGDLEAPAIEIEGEVLWNGTARVGSVATSGEAPHPGPDSASRTA
jgi:cytoskeletal protein CcmA (bactofilin family)